MTDRPTDPTQPTIRVEEFLGAGTDPMSTEILYYLSPKIYVSHVDPHDSNELPAFFSREKQRGSHDGGYKPKQVVRVLLGYFKGRIIAQ